MEQALPVLDAGINSSPADMVALTTGRDGLVCIGLDELLSKFIEAMHAGQSVYDLSRYQVQPALAVALLEAISMNVSDVRSAGCMFIDLTENRLGSMTTVQFSSVIRVLRRLPWLCVRFGYEITPPYLQKALVSESMQGAYETQVFVDRPWENPSNRDLASLVTSLGNLKYLEKLGPILDELKANSAQVSKLASSTSNEFRNAIKTGATALEYEMAEGIARFLQDGRIVAANRKWEACHGDVDCFVEGSLNGELVVVMGEAKTNMPTKRVEAVNTLVANLQVWRSLCSWDGVLPKGEEEGAFSKYHLKDYEAMDVAVLRDRRVILAVGGAVFPHDLDTHFVKAFKHHGGGTWLRVHLNGTGVVAVMG